MARISISIPDKLMAKLEPIKDSINISQLCRESLERRVVAFERAAKHGTLDLDGLIQRLRDEKPIEGSKFEDLGKTNAGYWLNTVSYLELRDIAENPNSSNMSKYKLPRAAFKTMKQDMKKAHIDCEGGHSVAYKTAWLDYVRTVWSKVVDQIGDSNNDVAEGKPVDVALPSEPLHSEATSEEVSSDDDTGNKDPVSSPSRRRTRR